MSTLGNISQIFPKIQAGFSLAFLPSRARLNRLVSISTNSRGFASIFDFLVLDSIFRLPYAAFAIVSIL